MSSSSRAFLIVASTFISTSVNAAVLNATSANINSVFASAKAGDMIRLSGSFGRTDLKNRTFSTRLTIDASGARFTDSLIISGVSGLSIVGGSYGTDKGTTAYNRGIAIFDGRNISIDKVYVQGSRTGTGIGITSTTNVKITNSTFERLKSGVTLTSVTGGTLTGNVSRASSSDGFDIADGHSITVRGNTCTGTAPSAGAHPDCVQLWSIKGKTPQSDITITGNTATGVTQGFTSFNATDGGGLRIRMTNNRVDTSMSQGVACYACVDGTITGNVVTTLPGAAHKTNINIIGGSNNIVANNSIGPWQIPVKAVVAAAIAPATSDFLAYRSDAARAVQPGQPMTAETGTAVAAVPEPATWMMMITGFGLVGRMMRRRRQDSVLA